MKKILVVIILFALFTNVKAQKFELKNSVDSASYSLGIYRGLQLEKQGMEEFNPEAFAFAVKQLFQKDKNLLIPKDAVGLYLNIFFKEKEKEKHAATIKEGENFLKKNKERKDVTTTSSGLQYEIIKKGDGAIPKAEDKVKVHYKGYFINGDVFDSSYKRGKASVFPVTGVIKGWIEALQLMPTGSKWKLYIPYNLGYGERGNTNIKPYTMLIFDVELISIETEVEK